MRVVSEECLWRALVLYSVAPVEYVVLASARGLEGGLDSSKSAHLNRGNLQNLFIAGSVKYVWICACVLVWV